jgi:hypothetical protein
MYAYKYDTYIHTYMYTYLQMESRHASLAGVVVKVSQVSSLIQSQNGVVAA